MVSTIIPDARVNGRHIAWAIPENLEGVSPDVLALRLDFYNESVVMQKFDGALTEVKTVSITDVAEALTNQLDFNTGLLPRQTLWMANTQAGRRYAFWVEPQVRTLGLQLKAFEPPAFIHIPLPGLIFICLPGRAPWVFATQAKRPGSPSARVYHAPFYNVFDSGEVCPGNHKFPQAVEKIPDSFFESFFSADADPHGRSKKHPKDVGEMWKELEGKKRYPIRDLMPFGTVADLMRLELRR